MAVQTKQLRILSTVLLSFAVGQAGLGSGYLDASARGLLIAHLTNAFAVVVLSVLAAVFGLSARRAGAWAARAWRRPGRPNPARAPACTKWRRVTPEQSVAHPPTTRNMGNLGRRPGPVAGRQRRDGGQC